MASGSGITQGPEMYPKSEDVEGGTAESPPPRAVVEADTPPVHSPSSGKPTDKESYHSRRSTIDPTKLTGDEETGPRFNQSTGDPALPQDQPSPEADNSDIEVCYEPVDEQSNAAGPQAQSEPLHRAAPKKRTFGLPKTTEAQKRAHIAQATDANGFIDRYDYLKKYPHDEPNEAMGPNARVWRVYLDEAAQFDIDMVDNFKDTVDVMLVFAGLFSAVVTTFVVQSSTALQLDYNRVMASILLEQLAIQRAFFNGSPIPDTQSPPLGIVSSTTTGLDRWTNGLWFISLSFSLATALFAVLVKQWIQAYVSPVSGPPQTQARVRHYRYMGLKKWHLPLIVGLLPTLLHLSLLLFLMGLVVFLFALDLAIAGVTGFIAVTVYIVYFLTNLAPVFDSQCPYKTPLSRYALLLFHSYVTRLQNMWKSVKRPVVSTSHRASQLWSSLATHLQPLIQLFNRLIGHVTGILKDMFETIRRSLSRSRTESPLFWNEPRRVENYSSMKQIELRDINSQSNVIDARAMCWVTKWSSNPSVTTVVIEAASDLPFKFSAKDLLREEGVASVACTTIGTWAGYWDERTGEFQQTPKPGFERLCYKAALVHHQLDLNPVPVFDQDHAHLREYCSCWLSLSSMLSSAPSKPSEVDYGFALKFQFLASLPQEPLSPMHILQFCPPQSPKIAFLHVLQQAIGLLREASCHSGTIPPDWPSCHKLLADIQLVPWAGDSYAMWHRALVPVYLACLVCPEDFTSGNSAELVNRLLRCTDMGLGLPEDLWGATSDFSARCCMRVLCVMLKDASASVDIEAWAKLRLVTQALSQLIHSSEFCPEGGQEIDALHFEFLSTLLTHEQYVNNHIPELNMLIFALGTRLVQGEYPDTVRRQLPGDICDRLMRLAVLVQHHVDCPNQLQCLQALLQWGHPSCIEIFRQCDGLSLLDKFLRLPHEPLDVYQPRLPVDCVLVYMRRVIPDCGGLLLSGLSDATCRSSSSQEAQRDSNGPAHFEYLLGHLVQILMICTRVAPLYAADWASIPDEQLLSPPKEMRGLLCRLTETRPDQSIWEDAFSRAEAQADSKEIRDMPELIQYLRQKLEEIHSYDAQEPQHKHTLQVNLLRASLAQVQSQGLSLQETKSVSKLSRR